MFEDALGRLVGGALWGVGAGVIVTLARGGGEGVRDMTMGLMKASLAVTDRIQEATSELRENFDDLAAEVRSEREADASRDAR